MIHHILSTAVPTTAMEDISCMVQFEPDALVATGILL